MKNKINLPKRQRHGVYNLHGVNNEHKVVIKGAGMIRLGDNESVADKMLERFTISENVFGELYMCNIVDGYLISTKRLPVMYISVIYEKPLFRSPLFSLFLYFTISSEVTSQEQLVGSELNGDFTIELILDQQIKVLDTTFSENGYPGKAATIENLKTMVLSSDLTPIIQDIKDKKDKERREKFLNMFPESSFNTPGKPNFKFDDLL